MKISKLFHWLYAFLMFLPIFAVFVQCAYVILNDNAKDSYQGTYKFNTLIPVLEGVSDEDITYTSYEIDTSTFYKSLISHNDIYTNLASYTNNAISFIFNVDNFNTNIPNIDTTQVKSIGINWGNYGTGIKPYVAFYDVYYSEEYKIRIGNAYYVMGQNISNSNILFSQEISNLNNQTSFTVLDKTLYFYYQPSSLTSCLQFWETPTYITDTNLSSVFYSSLQGLDNVDFFSWAKDSFIAKPFLYIGNLFGIESTHPIFTLLSYWTAISVIYLVFDLIMYVPLLVHRWLDKGIIE